MLPKNQFVGSGTWPETTHSFLYNSVPPAAHHVTINDFLWRRPFAFLSQITRDSLGRGLGNYKAGRGGRQVLPNPSRTKWAEYRAMSDLTNRLWRKIEKQEKHYSGKQERRWVAGWGGMRRKDQRKLKGPSHQIRFARNSINRKVWLRLWDVGVFKRFKIILGFLYSKKNFSSILFFIKYWLVLTLALHWHLAAPRSLLSVLYIV